ncbi:FecR domain-containing protein [Pedobacter aquatilis]|uniref:FecR family protein n=1 Tax=Pedobacter aquatilis TaxID=351343 RepID=UPI0025B53CC5|nr:FecR domain-containing protein [Pedobacter aquatilis]MDN3588527.1 FecR domain-containing protein [Pedobacter aquatilis]
MEEKEIYLLITRYLQKQTTTEENEVLADWITDSAKNEQTFEEIKLTWQYTVFSKTEESADALTRLKSRIKLHEEENIAIKKLNPFMWKMVAASLAAIFIVSFGLYYFLKPSHAAKTEILMVSTRSGEMKNITLTDGTKISVGPKSILRYPAVSVGNERNLELDGEAYFEVSKNPHKPFRVKTADLIVKVLGTHFNVNAKKNQKVTTVSLLEGKVEVNLNGDKDDAYLLKPGQELSFDRSSLRMFQRSLDSVNVLGWMTKTLTFSNEKLSDAAVKIENMYGVKIIFADQATADTRIYAQFKGDKLEDVLTIICAPGNLEYRKQGNKIYINAK